MSAYSRKPYRTLNKFYQNTTNQNEPEDNNETKDHEHLVNQLKNEIRNRRKYNFS